MKEIRRELAVFAHSDDSEWTEGGRLAQATKHHQVDLALITDSNGQGLGKQRLQEQRDAMNILGMTDLYPIGDRLEIRDGGLIVPHLEVLVPALLHIIDTAAQEGRPYDALSGFNERTFSGHPDHFYAYLALMDLWRKRSAIHQIIQPEMTMAEYKLWRPDYFVPVPLPIEFGCTPLDISSTRHLKVAAIEAHTSQLRNGGFEQMERVAILPPTELYRYTARP